MMCSVRVSTEKSSKKSRVEELIMGSLQHSILGGLREFLFVTKAVLVREKTGVAGGIYRLPAYLVAQLPHIAAVWLCLSVANVETHWRGFLPKMRPVGPSASFPFVLSKNQLQTGSQQITLLRPYQNSVSSSRGIVVEGTLIDVENSSRHIGPSANTTLSPGVLFVTRSSFHVFTVQFTVPR